MITLYEGVPGSGKSLYSAGQILEQLSLGHLVIVNYPFKVPNRKKYRRGCLIVVDNAELTPQLLVRWSSIWLKFRRSGKPKEHQIFLVIDEAGQVFNPREWQSSGRKDWLSFFAQHRKLMYDVLLIAQQDIQIDNQIRGCIDLAEKFSDIRKFFPGRGWYLPPVFMRSGRLYQVRDRKASRCGTGFFVVLPSWARCYDTYAIFGVGGSPAVQEPAPVVLAAALNVENRQLRLDRACR